MVKKFLLLTLIIFSIISLSCAKEQEGTKIKKTNQQKVVNAQNKKQQVQVIDSNISLKTLPKEYINSIKKSVGKISKSMTALIFIKDNSQEEQIVVDLFHDLNQILGDSIKYKVVKDDQKLIKQYQVKYYPTIIFLDQQKINKGVYFLGAPLGHELSSVLGAISLFVSDSIELPKNLLDQIKSLKKAKIEVLVSPHCPYCPRAAFNAHTIAYFNDKIEAYNVNANQVRELALKYNVSSVPLIVYNNGKSTDLGAVPLQIMIEKLKK